MIKEICVVNTPLLPGKNTSPEDHQVICGMIKNGILRTANLSEILEFIIWKEVHSAMESIKEMET